MDIYCDFNTAAPLKNGHYKPLEEKEQLKDQLLLGSVDKKYEEGEKKW